MHDDFDLDALIRNMEEADEPVGPTTARDMDKAAYVLRSQIASHNLTLTDEHMLAYHSIVVNANNTLLTGGAGVGKTTFLKLIIDALVALKVNVAVTATTGIAGSHLNGRTLHSWSGIGLGPFFPAPLVPVDMTLGGVRDVYARTYQAWQANPRLNKGFRMGIEKRIKATNVLIIDEISMCHGVALLDYLDYFLQTVRETDLPFGGIQMLFAGDFGQLPPVEKRPGSHPDWAFLSRSWAAANVIEVELTKVFRQADEQFARYLNRRRVGIPMTDEEKAYTASFVKKLTPEQSVVSSHLVTTNDKADKINEAALKYFPEPDVVLDAKYNILPHHVAKGDTVSDVVNRLNRSTIMRDRMKLRVGFPVLMTVNSSPMYVNGTKAKFLGYDEAADTVRVQLLNGREHTLERVSKTHTGDAAATTKVIIEGKEHWLPANPVMKQFPIIPAVAITSHKSQGMSLDDCVVDMSRPFAPGQVYVAISRVRTPEGLVLVTPNFEAQVCPHVLRYYAGVRKRMASHMVEFAEPMSALSAAVLDAGAYSDSVSSHTNQNEHGQIKPEADETRFPQERDGGY